MYSFFATNLKNDFDLGTSCKFLISEAITRFQVLGAAINKDNLRYIVEAKGTTKCWDCLVFLLCAWLSKSARELDTDVGRRPQRKSCIVFK